MQLDKNMLNRLMTMNDDQLAAFVQKIALESGIDPTMLGINPESIQSIRQALGSAKDEDIQQLNLIYEEYHNKHNKHPR